MWIGTDATVELRGGVTATGNTAKSGGAFHVSRQVIYVLGIHPDLRMVICILSCKRSGAHCDAGGRRPFSEGHSRCHLNTACPYRMSSGTRCLALASS